MRERIRVDRIKKVGGSAVVVLLSVGGLLAIPEDSRDELGTIAAGVGDNWIAAGVIVIALLLGLVVWWGEIKRLFVEPSWQDREQQFRNWCVSMRFGTAPPKQVDDQITDRLRYIFVISDSAGRSVTVEERAGGRYVRFSGSVVLTGGDRAMWDAWSEDERNRLLYEVALELTRTGLNFDLQEPTDGFKFQSAVPVERIASLDDFADAVGEISRTIASCVVLVRKTMGTPPPTGSAPDSSAVAN